MTVPGLVTEVEDALVDPDAFADVVEEEASRLKRDVRDGVFDKPQALVGLEYEFYGVDEESSALGRVPRDLLLLIGFQKELGLHNAKMNTSPQPLNRYGLTTQRMEVQARLDAAQARTNDDDITLVSDGLAAALTRITADGEDTTDFEIIYDDLFRAARAGLEIRGVPLDEIEDHLHPLEARVERRVTPAKWKRKEVQRRLDRGDSLAEAISGMQRTYVDHQRSTLVGGTFLDWLE